jgi:hypothetical protein
MTEIGPGWGIDRRRRGTPNLLGVPRSVEGCLLSTPLALELGYRESSSYREIGTGSNGPQNFDIQGDCSKMSSDAS